MSVASWDDGYALAVSTGWMAGLRRKAAVLIGASGFAGRVRELLRSAPAVHADETYTRPVANSNEPTILSHSPSRLSNIP